jgi:hypothetical protein
MSITISKTLARGNGSRSRRQSEKEREAFIPRLAGDAGSRAVLAAVVILFSAAIRIGELPPAHAAAQVTAKRLAENPLITVRSSASLGGNVNGPTAIRVPPWVEKPLGRYYMYFANHMGTFIRLAYADAIAGPWAIHEPGVLHVRDTAFFRAQPDPPENLENFYTHVASPEIQIDQTRRRLVMWFHGWWTDGARWPIGEPAAQAWAREHRYGQFTQAAESSDGIHFDVRPAISRTSYLRVFPYGGYFYGMGRLGLLLRSKDPLASFEVGTNPFRDGPYASRVRHVAVVQRSGTLYVFFTGIGDAPERVMMSTIDLREDWRGWTASPPVELLRPEAPYECATLPNVASAAGDVNVPVRQLRDPGVFEENGRIYLLYSICGEQGIAAAELTIR